MLFFMALLFFRDAAAPACAMRPMQAGDFAAKVEHLSDALTGNPHAGLEEFPELLNAGAHRLEGIFLNPTDDNGLGVLQETLEQLPADLLEPSARQELSRALQAVQEGASHHPSDAWFAVTRWVNALNRLLLVPRSGRLVLVDPQYEAVWEDVPVRLETFQLSVSPGDVEWWEDGKGDLFPVAYVARIFPEEEEVTRHGGLATPTGIVIRKDGLHTDQALAEELRHLEMYQRVVGTLVEMAVSRQPIDEKRAGEAIGLRAGMFREGVPVFFPAPSSALNLHRSFHFVSEYAAALDAVQLPDEEGESVFQDSLEMYEHWASQARQTVVPLDLRRAGGILGGDLRLWAHLRAIEEMVFYLGRLGSRAYEVEAIEQIRSLAPDERRRLASRIWDRTFDPQAIPKECAFHKAQSGLEEIFARLKWFPPVRWTREFEQDGMDRSLDRSI